MRINARGAVSAGPIEIPPVGRGVLLESAGGPDRWCPVDPLSNSVRPGPLVQPAGQPAEPPGRPDRQPCRGPAGNRDPAPAAGGAANWNGGFPANWICAMIPSTRSWYSRAISGVPGSPVTTAAGLSRCGPGGAPPAPGRRPAGNRPAMAKSGLVNRGQRDIIED